MLRILEDQRAALAAVCRRYDVVRLEVFGSASSGGFEPGRSDIDLLVEFRPNADLGPWLALYFDLKRDLEALLACRVDLVMRRALENPYFAREVDRTRKLLYAA
ncbi:MAG: nucleotidyltransferase family protein [Planctomycetota bacterium]|jgi:predicted nucleotidyltransferase